MTHICKYNYENSGEDFVHCETRGPGWGECAEMAYCECGNVQLFDSELRRKWLEKQSNS